MLIKGMTPEEIRVLQEYRRVGAETMDVAAIKAIKHPEGGGDAPAISLIAKGYLASDEARQSFTLTTKAKEFLAYDPKPEFEGGASGEGEHAE